MTADGPAAKRPPQILLAGRSPVGGELGAGGAAAGSVMTAPTPEDEGSKA